MNLKIVTFTTALISSAVGFAAGYFVAKKTLEKKYEELAGEEIEDARKHYAMLHKKDEFSTPENALKVMNQRLGYIQPEEEGDDVFEAVGTKTDGPYIISEAMFFDGSEGQTQVTLTYYAGDDVLVDENEQIVDEVSSWVGVLNLKRFGHESNDPRTVYIRNDAMKIDFEVVKSDNSYAEEVAGL